MLLAREQQGDPRECAIWSELAHEHYPHGHGGRDRGRSRRAKKRRGKEVGSASDGLCDGEIFMTKTDCTLLQTEERAQNHSNSTFSFNPILIRTVVFFRYVLSPNYKIFSCLLTTKHKKFGLGRMKENWLEKGLEALLDQPALGGEDAEESLAAALRKALLLWENTVCSA